MKSRMPSHSSGRFVAVTERGGAGETPEREGEGGRYQLKLILIQ